MASTRTAGSLSGRTAGLRRLVGWLLVVVWIHRPTPHRLLHTVPDNPGDASFVMWTMSALKHALLHTPAHLFDGNSFLPHRGTLLYSDVLAGLAVPYGVLTAIQPNPVLALNLVHLGMGLAALEATYRLCRRHGVRPLVSGAGAVAFAFSSFTLAHHGHVNLQAVAVFPIAVLLLQRVWERPSPARGAALGAFVAVVYLTVGYFALMLVVLLGALAVAALPALVRAEGLGGTVRRLAPAAGAALVVAALVAGPVVVAFLRTRSAEHLERNPDEIRLGRLVPSDHLTQGAAGSLAFGVIEATADEDPEHGLAPDLAMGAGVVVGAVTAVAARRRLGRPPPDDAPVAGYVLAGVVGAWLALGPEPGVAGLAYRAAAKLVPGFATVRVPARLALLLLFAVCVVGAIGWERALRAWSDDEQRGSRSRLGTTVGIVLLAVVVAQATTTLSRFPYDDRPSTLAVYRALAQRPEGATVVLPMRDVLTTSGTLIEASRLQWSTIDDHRRFNGYSSFIPPDYEARRAVLTTFPSPESLTLLDDLGIRYVILEHGFRSTLPVYSRAEVDEVLRSMPSGAEARSHGEAYLVERPAVGGWSPRARRPPG